MSYVKYQKFKNYSDWIASYSQITKPCFNTFNFNLFVVL